MKVMAQDLQVGEMLEKTTSLRFKDVIINPDR
jgi:hypothetical protein